MRRCNLMWNNRPIIAAAPLTHHCCVLLGPWKQLDNVSLGGDVIGGRLISAVRPPAVLRSEATSSFLLLGLRLMQPLTRKLCLRPADGFL